MSMIMEFSILRAVSTTVILFLFAVGTVLLAVIVLSIFRFCLIIHRSHDRRTFIRENRLSISVIHRGSERERGHTSWNTPPPAYDEIQPPPYSSVVKEQGCRATQLSPPPAQETTIPI